jgi:hypothetical protein
MSNLSTDQRASILAVITQEKATVAFYALALKEETRAPFAVRLKGLQAYHKAQIKRWKGELKG